MAATKADVQARWPALYQVADNTEFTTALADAALQVDASTWGNLYDLGVIHLSAHAIFLAHPEIQAPGYVGPGPVASEKVGEISRSYAVNPVSRSGGLNSTAAGQQFIRLRSMLGLGMMVV